MTTESLITAMNRVMNALACSLASYLRFARPRIDDGAEGVADTVRHVADSHRKHVFRVGELLMERHGHVESRTFPIAFTRLNDLSIEYLLPLVIEDEKQILALVESAADAMACDAEARELLAEVVASEKRHLRVLLGGLARSYATARLTSARARPRAPVWPATRERPHASKRLVRRHVSEFGATTKKDRR